MGKKISIDSATMMNKIFEIIEAKKIFDIELSKFQVLIHPKSYIHAIVKFKKPADLIISNSVLHHIHQPINFWRSLKFLSAKGTIHIHRDLRRPLSRENVMALQQKYLPEAPQVLVKDYLASLHAAFTVLEVKSQLQKEGLAYLNVDEVDDRYLEVVGSF